ncbi:1-deoxy-D-xylulose-5-phosphate reductoisomerase [candidate division TA06 bacterium B3_TA06]|uniref:1-deoxy-D-xylulose 5-phosphate reductoisomerase n=2 Tax=root TaxID=1 RepID=A0A532VA22_UNCT6|nr:MAG: 1-deoxy-D-xylulose-5-phosphate reductoisomerase [candidate division TA06 bacterium B3_TA06]
MKNVAILGSTGTIGRLSVEVIKELSSRLRVFGLAANRNIQLLASQIAEFTPQQAVVLDEEQCALLSSSRIPVSCGSAALLNLARHPDLDILVVAMTGTAAVDAVLAALRAGKRVALATKEILVSFGRFVNQALDEGKGELLPVDSEHNAIHQCLEGRDPSTVKRLILTASGGPFRNRSYEGAKPEDVLAHPTWNMGERITVDSAMLMNKGFEVIEAHFLFKIEPRRIKVLVHPQSIVHSLVEFMDGSVLAQLSLPDMRLPIEYALLYPERGPQIVSQLDLAKVGSLEFERADLKRFPCLALAYEALKRGGTAPAVLQAADEEAVNQFLAGRLQFERIPELIKGALEVHRYIRTPSIEETRQAERLAKEFVKQVVQ